MKTDYIEKLITTFEGHFLKLERNIEEGRYELYLGFPKDWKVKSSKNIEVEEIDSKKNGFLIKIYGKHDEIVIDDLFKFTELIIENNKKIAELKGKFQRELEERKKMLEDEIVKHQDEIDKTMEFDIDDEYDKIECENNDDESEEEKH